AVLLPLLPARGDAHALGGAAPAGVDEDVPDPVRIPNDEVARAAPEGHVAAVGGGRGVGAAVVPLRPARVDAHALGDAALAVADEDVLPPVRVPADEVGGGAREGHVAAVGGDRAGGRGDFARAVPLRPARGDAHEL